MSVSKNWCFTLNNYSPDDTEYLNQVDCKFIIYGKEVGANGTPHLQGYIVFNSNKRLSGAKKILPSAHWEISKGSSAQNIIYCSKEGDVTSRGVLPRSKEELGQDERQRWKDIIAHAKAGTLEEHDPKMYYLHLNTNEKLEARYAKPVATERKVKVFWGPTGTGKSMKAFEEAGEDSYTKDPRSKFWYGYHGQKNMVIDEFRGGIDIAHMLRWTDRYPLLVETKGSSVACKVINIWITSNLHPNDWYPDLDHSSRQALLRRLEIVEFVPRPVTWQELQTSMYGGYK